MPDETLPSTGLRAGRLHIAFSAWLLLPFSIMVGRRGVDFRSCSCKVVKVAICKKIRVLSVKLDTGTFSIEAIQVLPLLNCNVGSVQAGRSHAQVCMKLFVLFTEKLYPITNGPLDSKLCILLGRDTCSSENFPEISTYQSVSLPLDKTGRD